MVGRSVHVVQATYQSHWSSHVEMRSYKPVKSTEVFKRVPAKKSKRFIHTAYEDVEDEDRHEMKK